MKKVLILFVVLLNSFLWATGPSYAQVTLTPIATNSNGKVLFQTYHNFNKMGGSSEKRKYGWLVVSASGVWEEKVAFVVNNLVGNPNKKLEKRLGEYIAGKVNLSHPDKVLKNLMQKYDFNSDTPLINEKNRVLELKPKQSCYLGKCIDFSLTQKTIEGHKSTDIRNAIRSSFMYKGVALFQNTMHYEESEPNDGATFEHLENYLGERDIGYDITNIDGIVLLDSYVFRKPLNSTQSKIEEVFHDIYALLVNKKYNEFNKKYIHPKYGYYDLYAMAATAYPRHCYAVSDLSSTRRSDTEPLYLESFVTLKTKIKWEGLVDFDDEFWSKTGLLINDRPYTRIEEVMEWNKFDESFSKQQLTRARFLDTNILVVTDTKHDIIFHLKKIDNRWYVVVFDRAYTNRDA